MIVAAVTIAWLVFLIWDYRTDSSDANAGTRLMIVFQLIYLAASVAGWLWGQVLRRGVS